MKLVYVSDQRFYRDAVGNWYTTASFPLDRLADLFPYVSHWTVFGRLDETECTDDLYQIPLPSGVPIEFAGLWGMRTGLSGYLRRLPQYASAIFRATRGADILWLKTPFLASVLAWIFRSRNQITVTHMVGDPVLPLIRRLGRRWAIVGHATAWALRRMYGKADLCVFVSKDLLSRYANGNPRALVVNECRVSKDLLRNPANQGFTSGSVLFVGRLSGEKGVDTLVQACALVMAKRSVTLTLAGDGPERGALERLSSQLGVPTRFLGQVPWGERLWSVYADADLFVLPSHSEGLPLVLVEAMSQGVPVVATRVGGIPEIVTDGVSGLLVSPGNVDELARSILLVLEHAEKREALIEAGLKVARANTLETQTGLLSEHVLAVFQKRRVKVAKGSAGVG